MAGRLELSRWMRVGVPIHAVALSGDGRHILLGCERDLRVLDRDGNVLAHYHRPGQEVPVHLVAMTPSMDVVMIAIRSGELIYINLEETNAGFNAWPTEVYFAEGDLYDLSLAVDGQTLALGHLGPALTVLNLRPFLGTEQAVGGERGGASGEEVSTQPLLWRRHPDDRNATDGRTWTVAMDREANQLYVGCSGSRQPLLATLRTQTGQGIGYRRMEHPVTRVAALENPSRVAAVLTDGSYAHSLVCYTPKMERQEWRRDFADQITALAADTEQDLLVASSGYTGRIALVDGASGNIVAEHSGLNSLVTSLAVAGGRYIVAGTPSGQLAYLQYSAEGFQL